MEAITLNAKNRSVAGKQVKQLRSAGKLPAVVYGHGIASRNIELPTSEFEKTYKKAGESSLVDLVVEGKPAVKVLIQDVQRDVLTEALNHVDFREVNMNEKLEADIVLRFVGESPAVKELGGILVKSMDKLKVRCLPKDLVHEIEVPLASLKNFNDHVKLKDIAAPAGIEFLAKPESILVSVSEPISEEEFKALDTAVVEDVTAVKVETEEKKAADAAAKAEEEKAAKE